MLAFKFSLLYLLHSWILQIHLYMHLQWISGTEVFLSVSCLSIVFCFRTRMLVKTLGSLARCTSRALSTSVARTGGSGLQVHRSVWVDNFRTVPIRTGSVFWRENPGSVILEVCLKPQFYQCSVMCIVIGPILIKLWIRKTRSLKMTKIFVFIILEFKGFQTPNKFFCLILILIFALLSVFSV